MLLFVLILLSFDRSHRITFQHHGQSRAEPDPIPFFVRFFKFQHQGQRCHDIRVLLPTELQLSSFSTMDRVDVLFNCHLEQENMLSDNYLH